MLAVAVAAGVALSGVPAGERASVYLIERSLSLDNVFPFSLELASFLVPPELRGRVVLIGITGARRFRYVAASGGAPEGLHANGSWSWRIEDFRSFRRSRVRRAS